MSTEVIAGWLKDNEGNKFAPKTLASQVINDDGTNLLSNAVFAPQIESSASGAVVAVNDASNYLLRGITIYGKTTQNGTPTPDNPVELETAGASGTIKTTVCGKNLFNPAIFTDNGFTETDGVYYGSTSFLRGLKIEHVFKENTQYTISFKCKAPNSNGSSNYLYISARYTDDAVEQIGSIRNIEESSNACTTKAGKTVKYISFSYGSATSAYFRDVQLEEGIAVTDFELYKSGGTLTAQTPNGLAGIPVASGGNYTDESGQQWICDEVDFAKGVYVQRVAQAVLSGGFITASAGGNRYFAYIESFGKSKPWIGVPYCSYYPFGKYCARPADLTEDKKFGLYTGGTSIYIRDTSFATVDELNAYISANPLKVQYILAKENPISLSAEELAQYAALHTNKPNTTVYNDAGADMKLEYVADTKLYIDNKFTELAAAIVNNA